MVLNRIVKIFGGDPNSKKIGQYSYIVDEINALETQYEALTDAQLTAKTDEFRSRLSQGETLDDLLVEAFATVREASKRELGKRHYDVQLIGGIVLHNRTIAEMLTGEGKTLMATLPIYLNALTGKGVHLITVNDYLARRDARWMAPIFIKLGLSVGVLQMASRAEGSKVGYLVDLTKESPHEDQHQLEMVTRKDAYLADITYGTNNEFGFDYLRDNMTYSKDDRVQRGHAYAIIDEVDNVLIDEARTPLIISGPSHDDTETYVEMAKIVKRLREEDYEVDEKSKQVVLTEIGESHVEELIGKPLKDPNRPEDLTPEQARLMGFLEQALRAQFLFKRNKEYLVQSGKVVIIDEGTGRLMPGRRWSDGLHQAVEAKENVRVQNENVTYATITIQNYYRMYEKLAGMTGTALTEAEEFSEIYELEVLAIPSRVEFLASRDDAEIKVCTAVDEYNYKYTYYADKDDSEEKPVFWKRKDYPDVVFQTLEAKIRAIMVELIHNHVIGRPVLVGTTSVENSVMLSNRLKAGTIRKLANVLVIREAWMEKFNTVEGRRIPELDSLNVSLDNLNMTEARQLLQKLEIPVSIETDENLARFARACNLPTDNLEPLKDILKGGLQHQVLNARKHTEESKLIAHAGKPGSITIATNMAGRGVDIKLGGEIDEEVITRVNRVLNRLGIDYYELNDDEIAAILRQHTEEEFGINAPAVEEFLTWLDNMDRVKAAGGLHVVGSERHEARRIDNQLRGRAARQGDPGSSRFFLSMEDDLMRIFGGSQVETLMGRMGIDEALPLEMRLVGRVIEQAQTRVEGSNFDVRKHLLEYDDVLNDQRQRIYDQRDVIFDKQDLSENVKEMLAEEISIRVPDAMADEDGSWKLISWLNQIQSSFVVGNAYYPAFSLKVLMDDLVAKDIKTKDAAYDALINIVKNSIAAEKDYFIRSTDEFIDLSLENHEQRLEEKQDTLEVILNGLQYEETRVDSKEFFNNLISDVGLPLKLSNSRQSQLVEDPDSVHEELEEQVESLLTKQTLVRIIGAVERRLDASLDMKANEITTNDWQEIKNIILENVSSLYQNKLERLVGKENEQNTGIVAQKLNEELNKINGEVTPNHLVTLFIQMPQGVVTSFDKTTHRQVKQQTRLFAYTYYAGQFIQDLEEQDLIDKITKHLEGARLATTHAIGLHEWSLAQQLSLSELNELTRTNLANVLEPAVLEQLGDKQLAKLDQEHIPTVITELGRQTITEIYRTLLLQVISRLWVDYLTAMEGLRVSVGLEAYAQRDPLVQYKLKAFQMFSELLTDIRKTIVTNMFQVASRAPSSIIPGSKLEQTAQNQKMQAKTR